MCNKCEGYKNKSDYNFCPFCGEKLRECIFIPFAIYSHQRTFVNKTTFSNEKFLLVITNLNKIISRIPLLL